MEADVEIGECLGIDVEHAVNHAAAIEVQNADRVVVAEFEAGIGAVVAFEPNRRVGHVERAVAAGVHADRQKSRPHIEAGSRL